jgi:hypothetical protein
VAREAFAGFFGNFEVIIEETCEGHEGVGKESEVDVDIGFGPEDSA